VLPGTTWLYFALSQFPIYLSPQLLKPIVRRLTAQTRRLPYPKPAARERRSRRRQDRQTHKTRGIAPVPTLPFHDTSGSVSPENHNP
jgi:hypothetical protein